MTLADYRAFLDALIAHAAFALQMILALLLLGGAVAASTRKGWK